ncbi:MAG: helix-turn-helix transcriptional regulator [Clostridia bacterium]|jgi:transcriptional regulator with XRE-family HTH domain|nr:helix-turn-helix transcriptional regulator [Clostridia bacterium]
MDLGEKIITMRNEKNLSQEQLAEKLNVTRQTISNWENGKFYPDIDSLVNLSKYFNVSLDDLLSYDEKVLDYLKDSTDIVKSNKNILYAILLNILLIIVFIVIGILFDESISIIIIIFTISVISFSFLFYQIIKKI